MKPKKNRSACPINFAVEHFGDKWTLLIIRDLLIFGKRYYKEFLNSEEKIATNILADRLNMLEREGFVVKHTDEKQRSKYVYQPTEKVIDLLSVLMEMVLWSAKYDPKTAAPPAFIERLKEDRKSVMDEILDRIKQPKKEGK